jgi:putative chitinase
MNESILFAKLRATVFEGHLTQTQIDAFHSILAACQKWNVIDLAEIASALTPPMIETGGSYKLVEEDLHYRAAGLRKTFKKYFTTDAIANKYAMQPERIANRAYANRNGNGNEASGDGWKYRGRGWPQLTGRANYEKLGLVLSLPLIEKPELALDPNVSAQILVLGMKNGIFTSRKLSQYHTKIGYDFKGARDIINPGDRNADNERFGKQIYAALAAAE